LPSPKRFLPPDPRTQEPYRLTPQVALRIAVLGFLALAIFAVLFLRLWALQVLSGDKYRAQANDNRVRTIPIEAQRGLVLDRNGHVLVKNVLGTSVELWPADLPKQAAARSNELQRLSAAIDVPYRQIVKQIAEYADDPLTPIVLRRGIHSDQISYFKERQIEFPGVQLGQSYLRSYPYQSLAAHVLGYDGEITAAELKTMTSQGYKLGDVVGQAGVEATYDKYLRGTNGSEQLTVDAAGRPTSPPTVTANPQPGNNLRLTLDIGLQRAAEKALRSGIAYAHENGNWAADGGAIVAMNPNDGSVLAMASYPTYEPSVFVTRDPKKLAPLENPTVAARDNFPALNRAIDVGYPPGSTWKPVTALAAMETHILQPYTPLLCTGSYSAYGQTFNNWDPDVHEWMDLPTALEESCDTYFYQLGLDFWKLPPSEGHPLQEWASRFGFGQSSGIDIGPEYDGLVPTPEWRRQNFTAPIDQIWKPGYSIQLAIGQGDLLVTPIQMTRLYAMIANGGNLVTPHLAEDVEQPSSDPTSSTILRSFAPTKPTPSGVDAAALRVVQQGLYDGTHDPLGTSYGVFGTFPVSISGKTGTAEKIVDLPGYPNGLKLSQSWWCGYGPSQDAQLVVCAVIENGGEGGSAAAPAALQVFEKYFHKHGTVTPHPSD
jgi:penicillin-binding protein 2